MLLVPRQLQRSGMTGSVPYYGGRLTPAQAYAASHPSQPVPTSVVLPADQAARTESLQSLQHLRDTGVLTPEEYAQFAARVTG